MGHDEWFDPSSLLLESQFCVVQHVADFAVLKLEYSQRFQTLALS